MDKIIIQIGQIQIVLNVIIRIFTAVIFLFTIIPLQIKEAQVKNGLYQLRRAMLASGVLLFFVNTAGLSIILMRQVFGDGIVNITTDIVTITNSFGFLLVGLILRQIYHQQYTPENKELHEKISKLEEKGK